MTIQEFWNAEANSSLKTYDSIKLLKLLRSIPEYTELVEMLSGLQAIEVIFASIGIGYRMGLFVGEIAEIKTTEVAPNVHIS